MSKKVLSILAVFLMLGACADNAGIEKVQLRMEAIKESPRGSIDPPPEFKKQPTYSYSVHQRRGPFTPPSESVEVELVASNKQVEPDLTRPREYLENFSLDALRLGGSMQKPDEDIFAIIVDPDGASHYVQHGNFVGKNHGRIAAITETRIDVIEIVPDGHGGWVERPRALKVD